MYTNKNFYNYVKDRQVNIGYSLDIDSYKRNVIKTCFDSCDDLYKLKLKKKINSRDNWYVDNYLQFSKDGNYLVSGDNQEVLLWTYNGPNCFSPVSNHLERLEESRVSVLTFNNDSTKLFSGSCIGYNINHLVINDIATGAIIKKHSGDFIPDVSANPKNPNIIIYANNNSTLFFYDARTSSSYEINYNRPKRGHEYTSVECHPTNEDLLLVTTNCKNAIFTVDLRNFQIVFNYYLLYNDKYSMCDARYNRKGDQILVTRKRYSAALFNSNENYPVFEFDDLGYHSFCKQKKGCFAGSNDEFIVSGSDNFYVYVWEIPKEIRNTKNNKLVKKVNSAKFVLKGNKDMVNVVSYNYENSHLASYSLKNEIILWSPFLFNDFCKEEEIDDSLELINNLQKLTYSYTNYFLIDDYRIREYLSLRDYEWWEKTDSFNYSFVKLYKVDLISFVKKFKEDSNIDYIKSFIINYRLSGKEHNIKLLVLIVEFLKRNKNKSIKQDLTLLFETKKVFNSKYFIRNSLLYLMEQFSFIKKPFNEDKVVPYKPKKDEKIIVEKLKKIKLLVKTLIYDLVMIFKQNRQLYEVSFLLIYDHITKPFRKEPYIKFQLTDGIFEEKEPLNRKKELDLNNLDIYDTNETTIDLDGNICLDEDIEFCIEIKNNDSFTNHYSDEVLNNLRNSLDFKKKFKEEYKLIKII